MYPPTSCGGASANQKQQQHDFPTTVGSADVAIFWDLENVRIPAWCPTITASEGIRNKVAKYGRIVEKRLYYDSRQPSEYTAPRTELDLSGFTLVDCPTRNRKETLDKKLIVDVLCFAWERASRGAKACVVLITSDGDYSYALARLRDIGVFTIVIYRPDIVAKVLIDNANVVMSWEYDVLGGRPRVEDEEEPRDDSVDSCHSAESKEPLVKEEGDSEESKEPLVKEEKEVGAQVLLHLIDTKTKEHQKQMDESSSNLLKAKLGIVVDEQQEEDKCAAGDQEEVNTIEMLPNVSKQRDVADNFTTGDSSKEEVLSHIEEKSDHDSCSSSSKRDLGASGQLSPFEEGKKPNPEVQGKFAIFCSVVKDGQQRNVKEGIGIYSSWAHEAIIGSSYYDKIGEKDRDGYLRIRTLAFQKNLIEWGRRNLTVPGKPVVRVKGRESKEGDKKLSSETYVRLTYYGRAILEPNLESQENGWTLVEPKPLTVPKKVQNKNEESSTGVANCQSQPKSNNVKIFVGGLAWETTEDSLRSHFLPFGPVKQVFVFHGRGWGVVTFRHPEDTVAALKAGRRQIIDTASVEVKPYNK